jgi:hypothetical protein
MKKLTKAEQRQFIDEIFFVNKDRDFSGTFVDALKGAITFKKIDEILNNKVRAFNYVYAEIFKDYGILPNNLYDTLDKLYDKETFETFFENYVRTLSIENSSKDSIIKKIGKSLARGTVLLPSVFGLQHLLIFQQAVKAKWDNYKKAAFQYAEEYSKRLIKDEIEI